MAVLIEAREAARYAVDEEADTDPIWNGVRPRIHPSWLAGRISRLLRNSYEYGPSIHTRSRIQHVARAKAGQTVTVAGRFIDAFERKGRQYAVLDCVIRDEDGSDLVQLRHTTIYRVAMRVKAEPQ